METKTTANRFGAAKKVEKKSAKKEHEVLTLSGNGWTEKIERFEELKAQKDELDLIADEIKQEGRKLWLQADCNATTVKLVGEHGGAVLLTVMDKYASLPKDDDDRRVNELIRKYGETIIATKTIFQFNQLLLDKYETEITNAVSEAIDNLVIDGLSDGELDEVRANVLEMKVEKIIAPGSIKRFMENAEARRRYVDDLQPQLMLKTAKE